MAIIVTIVAPAPRIFPFSTLPDTITERLNTPRGEVIFNETAAVITAGAVGDSQALEFRCACPENFAYALVELHMNLFGAVTEAADWDDVARGKLDSPEFAVPFEMDSKGVYTGIAGNGGPEGRNWSLTAPVRALARPRPAVANTLSVKTSNVNLNGAVMTLFCYARFMMYDISQIHHPGVNSPELIR